MEPSFDATAYVADLRRFVPLETLSTELEGHLTTLKNRVSRLRACVRDFDAARSPCGRAMRLNLPLQESCAKATLSCTSQGPTCGLLGRSRHCSTMHAALVLQQLQGHSST